MYVPVRKTIPTDGRHDGKFDPLQDDDNIYYIITISINIITKYMIQ